MFKSKLEALKMEQVMEEFRKLTTQEKALRIKLKQGDLWVICGNRRRAGSSSEFFQGRRRVRDSSEDDVCVRHEVLRRNLRRG